MHRNKKRTPKTDQSTDKNGQYLYAYYWLQPQIAERRCLSEFAAASSYASFSPTNHKVTDLYALILVDEQTVYITGIRYD